MFDLIAKVLGQLLYIIYKQSTFRNLSLFCLPYIKLALPLTIKQLNHGMQEIQPELQKKTAYKK